MRNFVILFCLLFVFTINGYAFADDKAENKKADEKPVKKDEKKAEPEKKKSEKELETEKIVVTATKREEGVESVPKNVVLITREDIENSKAKTIGDLLDHHLGLDVKSYGMTGGAQGLSIRGSNASQVLILLDGRPINSVSNGEGDLSSVTLSGIERVEVIKGPASHLYGANALGGVVNIITKNPGKKPSVFVESQAGSFGTLIERLEHGYMPGKIGYYLCFDYTKSDGDRDNSAYRALTGFGKLMFKITDTMDLQFQFTGRDAKFGMPGPVPDPNAIPDHGTSEATTLFDESETTTHSYALKWNWDANEIFSTRLNFYMDYNDMDTKLRYDTFDSNFNMIDTRNTNQFNTQTFGGNIDFEFRLHEKNTLLVGFDYHRDRLDAWSREVDFGTGAAISYSEWTPSTNSRSVYLQNEWQIIDKLRLVVGGRLDNHSKYGSEVSHNAGLVITPKDTMSIKIIWGTSFRAPSFNDLYWPEFGNEDLVPEKGYSAEASLDQSIWDDRLNLHFGVFYWSAKDKIAWAPDSEGNWSPDNVNSQNTTGAELGLSAKLHEQLLFVVSYSKYWAVQKNTEVVYSDFFTGVTRTMDVDRDAAGVPSYQASARLIWTSTFGLRTALEGVFVGDRPYYYADYTYAPDVSMKRRILSRYFVANMNISYSFKKYWTIFLQCNNLLDKRYFEQPGTTFDEPGYPMPRRNFFLGASFNW